MIVLPQGTGIFPPEDCIYAVLRGVFAINSYKKRNRNSYQPPRCPRSPTPPYTLYDTGELLPALAGYLVVISSDTASITGYITAFAGAGEAGGTRGGIAIQKL